MKIEWKRDIEADHNSQLRLHWEWQEEEFRVTPMLGTEEDPARFRMLIDLPVKTFSQKDCEYIQDVCRTIFGEPEAELVFFR